MLPNFPNDWNDALSAERDKDYFTALESFVENERATQTIYPPADDVFTALRLTPLREVKVFLLGQDPYHGAGQAHGLSFSVRPEVKRLPPSLSNIYKELKSDIGCEAPQNGHLAAWAQQGVLLLNAVLTVREAQPNSHKDKGWETFTDAVLQAVNAKEDHVIFLLWGSYARKKAKLIDATRHTILESAHPSPLSAANGFFGSRPFSKMNAALHAHGQNEIDWCL